jgi:EmrB/QacA subfamily drug resistance transporter
MNGSTQLLAACSAASSPIRKVIMSADSSLRHNDNAAARANSTAAASGSGSSKWIALVVLSLAQLMVILDSTIVNIALPTAQHDLGFSNDDRQWVVTGYALAFGSLLLLGGRLSDQLGRKRMFIVGLIGFAVASAVGGAAPGLELLLIARVAQGAFAALLAPAALSLVSVTFSDNAAERGRAFGIFGGVSGAGGALGLLLGGILTQSVSWRWCLFVNLVIAAIALFGAFVWLREGSRPPRVRLDVAGTITIVLGLVGIVYGLGNAAAKGWTDGYTLGSVAAGVVLIAAFVLIERRVAHPLLPLRVLLDRTRGAAYLAVGASGIGSFAVFLFLTYFLEETLHFTPIATGLAFLPMVAMLIVGASVSGAAFMPRFGPRPLIPVGSVIAAIGMALLTGIGTDTTYAGGVLPALLVLGFGLGFVFGPAQNAATSGAGGGDAGVASALVNTTQQIGGSIGTAVFSALAAATTTAYLSEHASQAQAAAVTAATLASYHVVFWIAAAVFVAGGVATAILFRSGPLPIDPNTEPTLAA